MVKKLGGKSINMFSNSRLVVGQENGELEARDERMQEYLVQAKRLRMRFNPFSLKHMSKSGNTHADSLATLANPWRNAYLELYSWKIYTGPRW